MTKIVGIFFFLTLSLFGSSESVNFDCTYEHYQYIVVGRIYYCYIKHDVTVSSRNEVVSITGTHLDGLDNDKVDGFWVNSYVDYFPHGWEKYFKNIIFVWMGRFLKEVRPTDLKPFTKAKLFYLIGPIEVLEEGLFDNNPEVEGIFLSDSKLSHIDSNVFDNLSKLSMLMLRSNPCVSKDTYSKSGVPAVIKAVKNQCINADYAALEEKVKNLQKEIGSAALTEKVKNLEDEVKNSKFAVYFEEKLKSLKNV